MVGQNPCGFDIARSAKASMSFPRRRERAPATEFQIIRRGRACPTRPAYGGAIGRSKPRPYGHGGQLAGFTGGCAATGYHHRSPNLFISIDIAVISLADLQSW